MDRLNYQMLRHSIESELLLHLGHGADPYVLSRLVDRCMRLFVDCVSTSCSVKNLNKRKFLTFRRSPDTKAPSWAYRNPGIDSRLPKL